MKSSRAVLGCIVALVSLPGIAPSAQADALHAVEQRAAESAAAALRPGDLLLYYCAGCNRRFALHRVAAIAIEPAGRCAFAVRLQVQPLFSGRRRADGTWPLAAGDCLAGDGGAGSSERLLDFNYHYLPSGRPGHFRHAGAQRAPGPQGAPAAELQLDAAALEAAVDCAETAGLAITPNPGDRARAPAPTWARVAKRPPAPLQPGALTSLYAAWVDADRRPCRLDQHAAATARALLDEGNRLAGPGPGGALSVTQLALQPADPPQAGRLALVIGGRQRDPRFLWRLDARQRFHHLGAALGCRLPLAPHGRLPAGLACFDAPPPPERAAEPAIALSSWCPAGARSAHRLPVAQAFVQRALGRPACLDRVQLDPHGFALESDGPPLPGPPAGLWQLFALVPPPAADAFAPGRCRVELTLHHSRASHPNCTGCYAPATAPDGQPCRFSEKTAQHIHPLRKLPGPGRYWVVPVEPLAELDPQRTGSAQLEVRLRCGDETPQQHRFPLSWPRCM